MSEEQAVYIDEETKREVSKRLSEFSNSMLRVDSEKELMKTIVGDIASLLSIPKAKARKMCTTYHNGILDANEKIKEMEEVVTFVEVVNGS